MNTNDIADLSGVSPQQTFLESHPEAPSADSPLYISRFTTTHSDKSQSHTHHRGAHHPGGGQPEWRVGGPSRRQGNPDAGSPVPPGGNPRHLHQLRHPRGPRRAVRARGRHGRLRAPAGMGHGRCRHQHLPTAVGGSQGAKRRRIEPWEERRRRTARGFVSDIRFGGGAPGRPAAPAGGPGRTWTGSRRRP